MYRWMRTDRVKAGKGAEAQQWAKAIADLVNNKYPGHAVEANAGIFGAGDTLYWTNTSANLADLEAWNAKVNADEAYRTLTQKGPDYLVEGSIYDTLMRSI